MEIRINRDGEEFGPYTLEQANELLAEGSLLPTDLAWYDPMETWAALSQVTVTLNQAAEEEEASEVGDTRGGGRYRILKQLGRGGMGVVYLALDTDLNEEIALKSFPPEMAVDESALDDMKREVQKSRKLSHPNIIRIHDFVNLPGEDPFLTMEYVQGQELADLRRDQPNGVFAWEDIKHYILQLCDALTTAHNENTVHRDLKPTQMMINTEGRLKLCDFGIAASMADSLSFSSMKHAVSGTLLFMSPQQMNGEVPRATDDIYALGATLYDLMTGKPPFYTGNVNVQVMTRPAISMKDRLKEFGIENDIPDYVDQLVLSCLAKEAAHRLASAEEIKNWILTEGGAATLKTIRLAFKPPGFKKELVFDVNRKAFQITCSVVGVLLAGVLAWIVFQPPPDYDIPALRLKLKAQRQIYLTLDTPPIKTDAALHGQPEFQAGQAAGGWTNNAHYEGRESDRGIRFLSTNYIEIANVRGKKLATLQNEDYTLSVHYFPFSAPKKEVPEERQHAILMKQGHHLGLSYGHDRRFAMSHQFAEGSETVLVAAISSKKFAIKNWHHVVGAVNRSEGKVLLYVDGEEVGQAEFDPNPVPYDSKANPWRIGAACPMGKSHRWFADGAVDQVRMYNRTLNLEEVKDLYIIEQADPWGKEMLVHYPFKGRKLDNVIESLPSAGFRGGLNLVDPAMPELKPEPWEDRFGKPNEAYFFKGQTNSFSTSARGSSRAYIVSLSQSRAFSVWFKPEAFTTNRLCILNVGSATANMGWELLVDEEEGLIGSWSGGTNYLSGGTVKEGKWHHAVFSYDDTMKLISLYLDGDLLGTYTNQLLKTYSTGLNIGGPPLAAKNKKKRKKKKKAEEEPEAEITHSYFHGAIDDVRIYLRNLTAEEVEELYAHEKTTSWFWLYFLLFVLVLSGAGWFLYRKGYRIPAKLMNPILQRLPAKLASPLTRFKQEEEPPAGAMEAGTPV